MIILSMPNTYFHILLFISGCYLKLHPIEALLTYIQVPGYELRNSRIHSMYGYEFDVCEIGE